MATNRPRKPRAFKPVGGTSRRTSPASEAKKWENIAKRLERDYEKLKRENAALQRRAGRVQDPGETMPMDSFEDLASQLPLFEQDDSGLLVPSSEAGVYDPFGGEQDVNLGSVYEYYAPTNTINPGRPRTLAMSYDRQNRKLRVTYRNGGTYEYDDVPSSVWYRIRKVKSPGKFIDRNIKGEFDYTRVSL